MARIDDLKAVLQDVKDRLTVVKQETAKDVAIDEFDIDGESLRTPKLHNKWLSELANEAVNLKNLQNVQKKLHMERWKYYQGKATDKYYAEHGQIHEKILKTDLDIYLNADEFLCMMKDIMEVQGQIVDFLERTVKEISARSFHIKNAIEWRRFESGS